MGSGSQRWLSGEKYVVACMGKFKYTSGAQAGLAKDRMKKKHRSVVNVYRCQFCSNWHLGHDDRKGQRRPTE